MRKHDDLRRHALALCRLQGHKMKRFNLTPDPETGICKTMCSRCGLGISITKDGASISGEAFKKYCILGG